MLMNTPLLCEIHAPSLRQEDALRQIVETCARDAALQVVTDTHRIPRNRRGSISTHITLQMTADIAACQHEAWCMVCRLACFCPQARVSVLVLGGNAFGASADSPRATWDARSA